MIIKCTICGKEKPVSLGQTVTVTERAMKKECQEFADRYQTTVAGYCRFTIK